MRIAPALTAAAALALASTPAATAEAPKLPRDHSWGKLGVSYLQYRTDAAECEFKTGAEGKIEIPKVDLAYMDALTGEDPVDAARQTQDQNSRFLERFDVYDKLQAYLRACLRERGYRPFKLTTEQVQQLQAYRPGTTSRRMYLYSLAVDPTVLEKQGL